MFMKLDFPDYPPVNEHDDPVRDVLEDEFPLKASYFQRPTVHVPEAKGGYRILPIWIPMCFSPFITIHQPLIHH